MMNRSRCPSLYNCRFRTLNKPQIHRTLCRNTIRPDMADRLRKLKAHQNSNPPAISPKLKNRKKGSFKRKKTNRLRLQSELKLESLLVAKTSHLTLLPKLRQLQIMLILRQSSVRLQIQIKALMKVATDVIKTLALLDNQPYKQLSRVSNKAIL